LKTFDEQLEFYEGHWPAMRDAAESGGGQGVISFIGDFEDALERRILFAFARRGLLDNEWSGKSLDMMIEVADVGIAEALLQAAVAGAGEERNARLTSAHILGYNLAADLAGCWPGDETPRETRHFERGANAATNCLVWAEAKSAPDSVFSMDLWAKGIHELFLGRHDDAVRSFRAGVVAAGKAADAQGQGAEPGPDGSFGVNLARGFEGLALVAAADPDGPAVYREAIDAFTAQLEDDERKGDAQFGIDQLETTRVRLGLPGDE